MKLMTTLAAQTSSRKLIIIAGLFFAAVILFRFEDSLQSRLDDAKREYSADVELSKNGEEYREIYDQILNQSSQPSVPKISQNDWIRDTQDLVRRHDLELRELTPVSRKGGAEGDLLLRFEGGMPQISGFLHELSRNADRVSVSSFTMSQTEENAVEGQMLLTQD